MLEVYNNPNTFAGLVGKVRKKLSPKHTAHDVAQSTYPNYRHGKACLSKQPPWRAAGDPRLARGRSRVRAPGPAGALRALFFLHPPFLPPSGDSFFRTFPTNPAKVLGLINNLISNNCFSYRNFLPSMLFKMIDTFLSKISKAYVDQVIRFRSNCA